MHDEIRRTGAWAWSALLMSSAGCYASHRLPIEVEDLREVEDHPRLEACSPRFPDAIVLYDGPTFDDGSLDVTWTGTTFLVAFPPEEGVHWGAQVTDAGEVIPLVGPHSISSLSPVPGTAFVAAGGNEGLWLLDTEGNVVSGPSLLGPAPANWQWRMEAVPRPSGLAIIGSVWGYTLTGEAPPTALYAWSTAVPWSLPERMPTDPLLAAGAAWSLTQAVGESAFGAFVVAEDRGELVVIDFADDGRPRVSARWSLRPPRTLRSAVALPAGDFAILADWTSDEVGLEWLDVRTGVSSPLAPLVRDISVWTALEGFGEDVLIAAPFEGSTAGGPAPLMVRTYGAASDRHEAELVVDTEHGVREVSLARHPFGFSVAWRAADTTVLFQAFDCR